MRYFIPIISIFVLIFFGDELGYTNTSPWYTHFTYIFQHANFIHWLLNSIAFISMCIVLSRFLKWYLVQAFIIATIVSFFSDYDLPTVGISGVVYAMIGMFISLTFNTINNQKRAILYSCVFISLGVSFFKENSNFILHLICLLSGFILISIQSWKKRVLKK